MIMMEHELLKITFSFFFDKIKPKKKKEPIFFPNSQLSNHIIINHDFTITKNTVKTDTDIQI